MKAQFLSVAVALMLGFSFSAVAGTPEVKQPAPKATTETLTTYYVVSESSTHYTLSQNPADDPGCDNGGSKPCQFTSSNPALGTSVPKEMIDSQDPDEDILITIRRAN